jgi:anti-sigma factor RsiW
VIKPILPTAPKSHRDLQALLPWYAAGTLEAADREAVRIHLTECPACIAELADERRLIARLSDDATLPGVETGWATLERTLDREPVPTSDLARSRSRRHAPSRQAGRHWPGWAIAAQFAAVFVLGGVLGRVASPGVYHTLSSGSGLRDANVIVVFAPSTSEAAFRQILRSVDARLVDGPTAADAYMLHVLNGRREDALRMLRQQRGVVLAEPLDTD